MALTNLSALTSPLSELQLSQLQQAMAGLDPMQTAWVSGYLAGVSQTPVSAQATVSSGQSLTILYGTQTGNSKGVAEQLGAAADAKGIAHRVVSMADYKVKSIKDESHLIIVASTNGEGEAPDDAIDLHEFLATKKAPKLNDLKFAVLGLGDSSYEFFCQTGKDFEQRISALGATIIAERLDADVDYDQVTGPWIDNALNEIEKTIEKGGVASAPVASVAGAVSANKYDKQNPFAASLIVSQKITGDQSAKDVRHIEIDLEGSDLTYTAGDALGVWFKNDAALVAQIIAKLNLDASTEVSVDDKTVSLSEALIESYELTGTHPGFVEGYATLTGNAALLELASDKNALRDFANNNQIVDVISDSGNDAVTAENFLALLRRISPRLYSIASSQTEVEEEVHLTIGSVLFENEQGEKRSGGASGFLNHRLAEGEEVKVFIEDNHNFRLPANPETPIIMVGPGTGIAPFRSFMQEREATDATGKNWLLFGDQTFNEDFLYQVEWQSHLKSGLLTKLDLAFSRDQAQKIYVQDRLKENAAEVYQWLQDGAHFYVCGDANRMAKDVHTALIEIISEQGNKNLEEAEQELNELRKAKRYQRDVY
ncbi:assimilatory sulfite reductase (NADPH) flavoprotein subunit [Psychromonas sp. psych-6C06]|uniref:assimilatory sulfite reductase (NADPH) flavoprotein subunit n=1 Tax=Psychromonas sp. psych-6C06 TaxID=2058089 RepID=UPI000C34775E|nr:assimilatory sulfite reductase (NADPH) flavoprotein subunit [Psychromonas sp. psych-6C06]PKF61705.1 assimilatory sulfite reductase (NADPH) flavoprotein subunit [Psychromonas sp. psych-6C06]